MSTTTYRYQSKYFLVTAQIMPRKLLKFTISFSTTLPADIRDNDVLGDATWITETLKMIGDLPEVFRRIQRMEETILAVLLLQAQHTTGIITGLHVFGFKTHIDP